MGHTTSQKYFCFCEKVELQSIASAVADDHCSVNSREEEEEGGGGRGRSREEEQEAGGRREEGGGGGRSEEAGSVVVAPPGHLGGVKQLKTARNRYPRVLFFFLLNTYSLRPGGSSTTSPPQHPYIFFSVCWGTVH